MQEPLIVQSSKKITHFSSSESLSPTYKDKDSKDKVDSTLDQIIDCNIKVLMISRQNI